MEPYKTEKSLTSFWVRNGMRKIFFLSLLCSWSITGFGQKTILWKVSKTGSEHVSYLLGSFHQMGNSFVDGHPVIQELLVQSDLAVFESVEDRYAYVIRYMNERTADYSYRDSLDSVDVAFLESYTAGWAVPLCKQKPAELLVKLTQTYIKEECGSVKQGDTAHHMDEYIQGLAGKKGIPVYGLESYLDQFQVINNNPEGEIGWYQVRERIHFWAENLRTHNRVKSLCESIEKYEKMKIDYDLNAPCAENDMVLTERNAKWMPQVLKLVSEQDVFITVGLMHLFRQCGLIAQLRQAGYTVEPVRIK